MKKVLFTLVALVGLAFANELSAQVHFGVKGGANVATSTMDGSSQGVSVSFDNGYGFSYYIGGLAEFSKPRQKTMLQIELLYSNAVSTLGVLSDEFTMMQSYLMLPVLLKYEFAEGFSGYMGTYFAYMLGAESEYDDGYTEDIKDGYSDLDIGLVLGVEYAFKSGFFIEARYNFGITNMVDVDTYAGTGITLDSKKQKYSDRCWI
ncbi:MAG: porin family protein [Bacteroidales bacterium]